MEYRKTNRHKYIDDIKRRKDNTKDRLEDELERYKVQTDR